MGKTGGAKSFLCFLFVAGRFGRTSMFQVARKPSGGDGGSFGGMLIVEELTVILGALRVVKFGEPFGEDILPIRRQGF
jgi:hypothetical protein